MTATAGGWAGIGIAEEIGGVATAVESRGWINGTLAGAGVALDGISLAMDPVGSLLQYGIAWLIEHVEPLADSLDKLAGDAAMIAAHANTWRTVAAELSAEADGLAQAVRWDVEGWSGPAGEAYRSWAERQEQALRALGVGSGAMAAITEGSGGLIGAVRLMVRDAVAAVVARLIVYAGELIITAGVATPLVIGQVAALCASWSSRIAEWLRALISSLRRLLTESDHLGDLIQALGGHLHPAMKAGAAEMPPARSAESGTSAPKADDAEVPSERYGGGEAPTVVRDAGEISAAETGDSDAAVARSGDGDAAVARSGDGEAAVARSGDGEAAVARSGDGEAAVAGSGGNEVRVAGSGGDGATAAASAERGPGTAGFDPGRDRAPLGDGFRPGAVHDPEGRFEPKERAIADRLAGDGAMVHPRPRVDDVRGLTNPDAMVRTAPDDAGTITEFKTPESATSGSVRANILEAGRQVGAHGGGDVVIDGRAAGLTEEAARQGFARAFGQAQEHGSALPARIRVILNDGTILEFP